MPATRMPVSWSRLKNRTTLRGSGTSCPATPISSADAAVPDETAGDPLAVLTAMAKQMPWAGQMMAVLTPTTSPRELTRGPPELPGLRAASVWMTSSISRPLSAAQRPAQGADHAGRHRRLEAEGVADGDGHLPDADGGESPRWRPQVLPVYADDGEVGVRVVADHCAPGRARRRASRPAAGAVHDVAVGKDEAVGEVMTKPEPEPA